MESKDKDENSLLYRLWLHKSPEEKKRIKSFIPLILYTGAFIYGVIYLSILNTVYRDQTGTAVKRGWSQNLTKEERLKLEKIQREIEASFQGLRKRVSGERGILRPGKKTLSRSPSSSTQGQG
ncbi:MAG: hypothetical protein ACE5GQ_12445 [Nitrospinales bacterium]